MRTKHFSRNSEKENIEDNGVSSVFDDEETTLSTQAPDTSDMLTLEGIRRTYNSCTNCGVSWYDDHVSLDCSECGGYSMTRPCPTCNGQCGSEWRRDVKASWVKKQAQWHGTCSLNTSEKVSVQEPSFPGDVNANYQTCSLTENVVNQTHLFCRQ